MGVLLFHKYGILAFRVLKLVDFILCVFTAIKKIMKREGRKEVCNVFVTFDFDIILSYRKVARLVQGSP